MNEADETWEALEQSLADADLAVPSPATGAPWLRVEKRIWRTAGSSSTRFHATRISKLLANGDRRG
ncbi:hypothetical protein [Haloparvum sp. AD34]